mmetsp:Transcript_11019/g.26228  ORF Transcript_11019/g.26228 Transcript_11019/m.26228 type:complete len:99 (-) Transcript_11019:2785-3081(-)
MSWHDMTPQRLDDDSDSKSQQKRRGYISIPCRRLCVLYFGWGAWGDVTSTSTIRSPRPTPRERWVDGWFAPAAFLLPLLLQRFDYDYRLHKEDTQEQH